MATARLWVAGGAVEQAQGRDSVIAGATVRLSDSHPATGVTLLSRLDYPDVSLTTHATSAN